MTDEPLMFGAPKSSGSNMSLKVEQDVVIHFDSYGRIGKQFESLFLPIPIR